MSYGLAVPSVGEVMPAVAYPDTAVTGALQQTDAFQHTGALHTAGWDAGHAVDGASHALGQAAGHTAQAVTDHLQAMVAPALVALESLSGALLAGRAAMVASQVLASAALNAAAAQDALRAQQLTAQQAAQCWRQAAFAAVRVNARVEALRAGIHRRSATGPGGPVPGPPLPPPVNPVGMTLDTTWRVLAETEGRLRKAEAAWARSAMEMPRPPGAAAHAPGPESTALHERLRARRRAALDAYERSSGAAERADVAGPAPDRGAGDRPFTVGAGPVGAGPHIPSSRHLSELDVLRLGGDVLAGMSRHVCAEDYRSVEAKIAEALEAASCDDGRAGRHLREARRFAERATRRAERRQADEEWAARQLAFLRDTASRATTVRLPDASAEVTVLEAVLYGGREFTDAERQRIAARVGQWTDALQRVYTFEVIRSRARMSEPRSERHSVHGDVRVWEYSPPGWDPDHVLRISLDGRGVARVSPRRQVPVPEGEETYDDLLLDWERCVEAPRHTDGLTRLTAAWAVDLTFEFEPLPERPQPTRGRGRAQDDRPAPRARRHDQERHS